MKNKTYIYPIIIFNILLGTFISCANDVTNDVSHVERKETIRTIFSGTSDVKIEETPQSRTSIDYTYSSGVTFNYYWEPGDYIWINDADKAQTDISSKALKANFSSSSEYTGENLYVKYMGKNSTSPNMIDLTGDVTQTLPNDTKHLGYMDCGDAIASRQSGGSYKFTLRHKLAFLCLLPRTPDGLSSTYIKEVKIRSDKPIGGKCKLEQVGGLTLLSNPKTEKIITLGEAGRGFPLTNNKTDQNTNAIYVGIIPGNHTLTMEYKLYNERTHVETIIKKELSPKNYKENTLTPVLANLEVYDLNYYLWDAEKDYWYGKTPNSYDYPKEGDNDGRWANMAPYPAQALYSCKDCPNVNEIIWYIKKGDPHYDASYQWTMNGVTYTGGLWFKKQRVILSENPGTTMDDLKNHAPNETIDYRSSSQRATHSSYASWGRPTNLKDYFFLPSSGYYYTYSLYAGNNGYYWSSSPDQNNTWGYGLYFDSSRNVGLHDSNYSRILYGLRTWRAR